MTTWSEHFRARAAECGIPIPGSLYTTAGAVLGFIKVGTDMLKDLGPDAIGKMPLTTFLAAMWNRAAYDAGVRAFITGLQQRGFQNVTARFALGSQVGTGAGAVTTTGGILASIYLGSLIGCAVYATDKSLGGGLDEAVTGAATGFWEWKYDVAAKRQMGEQMERKLAMMRQLRGLAEQLGKRPSELVDEIARGMQQQGITLYTPAAR